MPLERSLAEVFGAHADQIKHDIWKCRPATITAVHADRQTVDVQVAINGLIFDDLGSAIQEPAPSFSDIPLGVMRGGGFLVWLPVAVGDSVLLMFTDLSTDTWRAGDGTAQGPGWAGQHTCDSAFAIPCCAPDAKMMAAPNADPGKVIIGKDGASAQIRISATDIELGAPATAAVALNTKIDSLINVLVSTPYTPTLVGLGTFFAALTTWQGTNWTPGPTATVGSTLVKSG